jgi:hypothetical protein
MLERDGEPFIFIIAVNFYSAYLQPLFILLSLSFSRLLLSVRNHNGIIKLHEKARSSSGLLRLAGK